MIMITSLLRQYDVVTSFYLFLFFLRDNTLPLRHVSARIRQRASIANTNSNSPASTSHGKS